MFGCLLRACARIRASRDLGASRLQRNANIYIICVFFFASPCFVWDVLTGSSVSAGPLLNGGGSVVGRPFTFLIFCPFCVKSLCPCRAGVGDRSTQGVPSGMNPPALRLVF